MKMLGIVAGGVVRSPEIFQGTHMYCRAHCAVIFAIAQLSFLLAFDVGLEPVDKITDIN